MIFVTVGEQLPFDRLVCAMDRWATNNPYEIFAQVGRSDYKPTHIRYKDFLDQDEFMQCLREARLVVAHAGMGTIISALEMEKPILVIPRKSSLGEHRNDHQLATAKRFSALGFVEVVHDEQELGAKINEMMAIIEGKPNRGSRMGTSSELIHTIRTFILSDS